MPDFNLEMTNKEDYSNNYKELVFSIWWKNGKPPLAKLQAMLPPEEHTGTVPSYQTLKIWKDKFFLDRAAKLDQEFFDQVTQIAVQEKIEMLERHAKNAKELEDIALRYIKDHEGDLTMQSAIRLLVEGVRIERDSRGIPDALAAMSEKTDDELLEELKKLMSESNVELPSEIDG